MTDLDPLVIGAQCTVQWNQSEKDYEWPPSNYYFSFGKYGPNEDADEYGVPDAVIFRYVWGMGELESMKEQGDRDWYVISIDEPMYERNHNA